MISGPDQTPPAWFWVVRRGWAVPLICGAAVGLTVRLLFWGEPGQKYAAMMFSFAILAPVLIGAVTVFAAERMQRRSWGYYFGAGAAANALFIFTTLLFTIEGLICAILAVPLFAVMGGIGGLIMGAVCRWTKWPSRAVYGLAALPLVLGGFEQRIPLPDAIHSAEVTRVVAAAPEQVWEQLAVARDIQPAEIGSAWMYRIGVPLPTSAVTERADGLQVRHIAMGKGIHFDQIAADWQPNQRIRWLYRFSSDSFPAGALDDHVRIGGPYFDLIDTEYSLRAVGEGTELKVRMRYRVSTAFNWYARPIAHFLVRDFESAALGFYARRAEKISKSTDL